MDISTMKEKLIKVSNAKRATDDGEEDTEEDTNDKEEES